MRRGLGRWTYQPRYSGEDRVQRRLTGVDLELDRRNLLVAEQFAYLWGELEGQAAAGVRPRRSSANAIAATHAAAAIGASARIQVRTLASKSK